MTATAGNARPAGPGRLTRERVLQVALDYVDEHGLEALSIRKLGVELGVPAMSLYSHVDSKDALLDGLVEAMTAELEMPSDGEADWRQSLRRFASSTRNMIHRHPATAALVASRHILPTHRLEVTGAYLQVLQRAGFTEDRALEVLRVVQVYAEGQALAEVSWGIRGRDPSVPSDDIGRLRWAADMVPRDAPDSALRTAIQYCAQCDMNHQFQVGLDLIIRGLEPEVSQ